MAVNVNEPIEPAEAQFGDFRGTAAADGHHGPRELAREVGLDANRYDLIGFEFKHSQLEGEDGLTVFAVDRENLDGLSTHEYAAKHGEIPVTDFLVHDMPAIEVLARGLKRFKVQLISRNVPEGIPLRRTVRDDLNRSGD